MNMVGDKERIAVEYDLVNGYGAEWLFGHFCFFFGGSRFGDYGLVTSLRDVLFQLEQQAWARGNRSNERFKLMTSTDVFFAIDSALFGVAENEHEALAEEEQWARHFFLPSVDVFNYCKAYYVESNEFGRILFSTSPYKEIREVIVSAGEIDVVLDVVRAQLGELYENEIHGRP
jgi:Immunity protein 42